MGGMFRNNCDICGVQLFSLPDGSTEECNCSYPEKEIILDREQWEFVLNLIENPPAPTQFLIDAFKKHNNKKENHMTSDNRNVRFTYLQDPQDNQRVLAIGRTIHSVMDDDTAVLHFAYSVNHPKNTWGNPGDMFSKKIARKIIVGRLGVNPSSVLVKRAERAFVWNILKALAENENRIVARIAAWYMMDFEPVAEVPEPPKEIVDGDD